MCDDDNVGCTAWWQRKNFGATLRVESEITLKVDQGDVFDDDDDLLKRDISEIDNKLLWSGRKSR